VGAPARRSAQSRGRLAVLARAVQLGEGAVPHVRGSLPVAQVAEHVRPGDTGKQPVQFRQYRREPILVGQVDGHQLAAAAPAAFLRVDRRHRAAAAQELEREPLPDAVVPGKVEKVGGELWWNRVSASGIRAGLSKKIGSARQNAWYLGDSIARSLVGGPARQHSQAPVALRLRSGCPFLGRSLDSQ
jgi:hypothetical protein